jgi:hypothetical protein
MNRNNTLLLLFIVIFIIAMSGCTAQNSFPKSVDVTTEDNTIITVSSPDGIALKDRADDFGKILLKEDENWMFSQDNKGSFELIGTFDNLSNVPPVSINFPNDKSASIKNFILDTTKDYRGVNIFSLSAEEDGFTGFSLGILNKKLFQKNGYVSYLYSIDNWDGSKTPEFVGPTRSQEANGDKFIIKITGRYY